MQGFSTTVKLGDLNDFITPSQACVNPNFASSKTDTPPATQENGEKHADSARVKTKAKIDLSHEVGTTDLDKFMPVEVAYTANRVENGNINGADGRIGYLEPKIMKPNEENVAQVSLADCLACSGCVTSAETVLIELQSKSKFLDVLRSNATSISQGDEKAVLEIVVVVSMQSLASLATVFHKSLPSMFRVIKNALLKNGVAHVRTTEMSDIISLLEVEKEFLDTYRSFTASSSDLGSGENGCQKLPGTTNPWKAPPFTAAMNKTEDHVLDSSGVVVGSKKFEQPSLSFRRRPLITSTCPGWICYIEKQYPEVISYLSTSISSQQISSLLIQKHYSVSPTPKKVFVVTIMPCPDKKLEASRKDFYSEVSAKQDVDLVLTTTELSDLLEDFGIVRSKDVGMDVDSEVEESFSALSISSSGSGGYVDFLFRSAAKKLFSVNLDPSAPLPIRKLRNKDFRCISLQKEKKTVLSFALVYGFRNIQSIIRQLKHGTCKYDLIEIMACPGGCLNGGGQIRPQLNAKPPLEEGNGSLVGDEEVHTTKEQHLQAVEQLHGTRALIAEEELQALFSKQGLSLMTSKTTTVFERPGDNSYLTQYFRFTPQELLTEFHTRFHTVPKLLSPLLEEW